ncbi:MAG: rod shape-determining protein RodA [marine bacterium B5-7]|nr:MAG: rod shape-determining protein RodA [marine bacterium B5-7]
MQAKRRSAIDPSLLMALLLLSSLSLVVLYSAGGESYDLIWRQFVRLFVALLALIIFSMISPDSLRRWSPHLFIIGTLLLTLVLVIGYIGKGAQRWLDLGVVRFQPAEIMKLAVPMMIAWILSRRSLPPGILSIVLASICVVLPAVLVILQPDLGTAILIAVSGLLVIFLAGLRWQYIVATIGLVMAAAPLMWFNLHAYQQRRILTLFDPYSDPLGAGYHTIQSTIAVGSGGLHGKGWIGGTQSQLEFIPERSTDFIFAVFAEEFGLIGSLLILSIYLFIVGRTLVIAFNARDAYSRLLTASLSLTFFFYVFVNIGMVTGILPVVGVPLPLISYGGTSMVTLMAGFGIVMSVNSRKHFMA